MRIGVFDIIENKDCGMQKKISVHCRKKKVVVMLETKTKKMLYKILGQNQSYLNDKHERETSRNKMLLQYHLIKSYLNGKYKQCRREKNTVNRENHS